MISNAEQVTEDGVGRVVERFQLADVKMLFQNQSREIVEKTPRITSSHYHGVSIQQFKADDIRQLQQGAGQLARLVAGNEDRQRVSVEQVADLRQGADRGDPPMS